MCQKSKQSLTNLVVQNTAVPFKVRSIGHSALASVSFSPFVAGLEIILYEAVHSISCSLLNVVNSLEVNAFDLQFHLQKQKEVAR
jgi:hypothetical protein